MGLQPKGMQFFSPKKPMDLSRPAMSISWLSGSLLGCSTVDGSEIPRLPVYVGSLSPLFTRFAKKMEV